MAPELYAHLAELIAILTIGWKIIRKITELLDVFKEYPPHRHINGNVVYPKNYEPSKQTKLIVGE